MGTEIGTLAVRRSIHINAPPESVWQEFESFERMRAWFGTGHTLTKYEPRVGGMVEFDAGEDEGERLIFGGRMLVFDPPREVTWESGWIGEDRWEAPPLITIRLTAALGGTLVELFSHAIERIGKDAAERHRGYE